MGIYIKGINILHDAAISKFCTDLNELVQPGKFTDVPKDEKQQLDNSPYAGVLMVMNIDFTINAGWDRLVQVVLESNPPNRMAFRFMHGGLNGTKTWSDWHEIGGGYARLLNPYIPVLFNLERRWHNEFIYRW